MDDTLAEAHSSLGDLLQYHDWNWEGAEREYRRAIQLNPSFADAHLWYSDLLVTTGRNDEAVAEGRRALQLDPYSFFANSIFGQTLLLARRTDEAIEQARKTLDQGLDPVQAASHKIIGLAYEQKGDLSSFESGACLCGVREETEALRLLAQLSETSRQRHVSPDAFAMIYAGLGEKDRVFEWLEKGYDERPSGLQYLRVEPRMESLRSDPRYQELLRRMGLPP